jgi:hypothetical protein
MIIPKFDEFVNESTHNGGFNYRIITLQGTIKYAGTNDPSWLTLDMARKLVDHSKGEMIYEFDKNRNRLWEIF